mgnify:CR=1 FL=1
MNYSEGFIRSALKLHLQRKHSGTDLRIAEEIHIDSGLCRFDVGLITGTAMHGFENKSDQDTLTRLEGQVESYGKFFQQVSIVSSLHWHDAQALTPQWVGILIAGKVRQGEVTWIWARRPKASPLFVPAEALSIFWHEYLTERITALQGSPPPKRWTRAKLADQLASLCGHEGIAAEVMRFLDWRHTKLGK